MWGNTLQVLMQQHLGIFSTSDRIVNKVWCGGTLEMSNLRTRAAELGNIKGQWFSVFGVFFLEYICFTMFCQFLLYSKVSQLHVYLHPFLFRISFPFRSPQSVEESSLVMQQVLISHLFYTQWCMVLKLIEQSPAWDSVWKNSPHWKFSVQYMRIVEGSH